MENITEDYVSFKVAKLLKEKGFNEPCMAIYEEGVLRVNTLCEWKNEELSSYVAAPTLQMACKWLETKHDIFISINRGLTSDGYVYSHEIHKGMRIPQYAQYGVSYSSNKEAIDKAIEYCLEKLI